jgi:hypothetical protein
VSNTAEHGKEDFAVYVCEKAHIKENNRVITSNTHGKDFTHGKEIKEHTVKNCTRQRAKKTHGKKLHTAKQ